jgi:cell division protein FtsN
VRLLPPSNGSHEVIVMSYLTSRHKQSRRGWIVPALKVTLVVVLMVGAFAVGFLKLGPAWRNAHGTGAGHEPAVSDHNAADKTAADADRSPSTDASAGQPDQNEPRVVSVDKPLASVYITERPGREGNVIERRPVEPPASGSQDEGRTDRTVEPTRPTPTEKPPKPAVDTTKPKVTPTAPVPPPTPEDVSGQVYRVQIGLFMERASAEALLGEVRAKGFEATLALTHANSRTFYRVQAGAFAKWENADAACAELERAGFSPTIVNETGE